MTAELTVDLPGDWRQRARCREVDPSIFHPGAPGYQPEKAGDPAYEDAKRICARCPVQAECLEDALATRDPWGVRGRLDPWERLAVLQRRQRGQRRAATAADTERMPATVGGS